MILPVWLIVVDSRHRHRHGIRRTSWLTAEAASPPPPVRSGLGEDDLPVVPLGIALQECPKAPVVRIRLRPVGIGPVYVLAVPTARDPVLLRIVIRPIDAHPLRPGREVVHHLCEEPLELLLLAVFDPPARNTAVHAHPPWPQPRAAPILTRTRRAPQARPLCRLERRHSPWHRRSPGPSSWTGTQPCREPRTAPPLGARSGGRGTSGA